MDLGGEEGVVALFQIVPAKAGQALHLVDAAIEKHMVIGHVHVAVEIDPRRIDRHHRRDKRREKDGFEITAVEHAVIVR